MRRQFTEAEVAAWRERIFADGLEDPVKVAVEEAVRDFGRPEDFTIWAWYANRIGVNSFLELYFEQKSVMRECRMRSTAAAFHSRLKRFYAAYFGFFVTARGPCRRDRRNPGRELRRTERRRCRVSWRLHNSRTHPGGAWT